MINYLLITENSTPLGVLKVTKDVRKLKANICEVSQIANPGHTISVDLNTDNLETEQEIRVWYEDFTYAIYRLQPINLY